MSRILRRPMFRGGSANEGIMSVPRKGYARDGFVDGFENEDDVAANESLFNSGTITTNAMGLKNSDSGTVDINKYNAAAKDVVQSKGITADKLKNLSVSDIMMAEYLGNRPDPLGKFLIQFGLNYMSARPKGGKFGALATAAEAAKKPTEQLYADVDTDRLLKLKLMTAIGKSDSKVALEKEAKLLVEQGIYPDMKTALNSLIKARLEKKTTSPEERKRERSKEIMNSIGGAPNIEVANNMAEFEITGINKLSPSERSKLDLKGSFYVPASSLKQKPNSTDFGFLKPDKSILAAFEEGLNYVDPGKKSVYTYVGPNTFRFVSKY